MVSPWKRTVEGLGGAENLDDFVVQGVDEQVTDGKLWRVNATEGILGRYYYSAA